MVQALPTRSKRAVGCGAYNGEDDMKQDKERKARTLRNTYDPYAPVVKNSGWVSTIHSLDYSIQHGDHIKFMARFQPRPDEAAAWMFNKGE